MALSLYYLISRRGERRREQFINTLEIFMKDRYGGFGSGEVENGRREKG